MKLSIAVVDDAAEDRRQLSGLLTAGLQKLGTEYETAYFESGKELLAGFRPGRWDLAFLDICMEEQDGITLAKKLRSMDPHLLIVFLTSSREYAFDAFPVHPFDYLLKPCREEDLMRVLQEALRLAEASEPLITIRASRAEYTLPLSAIFYVLSQGHSVDIATSDGRHIRSIMTFYEISDLLCRDPRFLACNRGALINMDAVVSADQDTFLLNDGTRIPIRVRGRAEIMTAFANYQFMRIRKG